MDLAPGSTIGPYTIEQEVGRGGMGVVYRGHDTRLDRPVAVKALPPHFAEDPGRLERFEREARSLALLNHPNVAGIYGVEHEGGGHYLILEYVEGQTLADRLDDGPLPIEDALETAIAIASGVEAAHAAGVVHRDLKPDNIRITPAGQVKVLDFGLAKSAQTRSSAAAAADDETVTTPRSPTHPGAVLGTAPYMSPEQARGRSIDKRTDVWSFGVILFEMLTGAGPFVGESAADSIGAILHKDVDLDQLPADTPTLVRHVLDLCLQRTRNDRLHDIADARIELQLALARPEELGGAGAGAATSATGRRLGAGVVGLLLGGVIAASGAVALWPEAPVRPVRHFEIDDLEDVSSVAISPDGTMLAMTADNKLFVRDMDSGVTRALTDDDDPDAVQVFWSPDGRWIGCSSTDELWKIRPRGGEPTPIADQFSAMGMDWSADGRILLSTFVSGLMLVPAEGGRAVEWARSETDLHFHGASFLPDGSVVAVPHSKDQDANTIVVIDRAEGRRQIHTSDGEVNNPVYAPTGHIVFTRSKKPAGIWALPYSVEDGAATGEPFLVHAGGSQPSVSKHGDLVFLCSAPGGE
jgi:hypothetical protein